MKQRFFLLFLCGTCCFLTSCGNELSVKGRAGSASLAMESNSLPLISQAPASQSSIPNTSTSQSQATVPIAASSTAFVSGAAASNVNSQLKAPEKGLSSSQGEPEPFLNPSAPAVRQVAVPQAAESSFSTGSGQVTPVGGSEASESFDVVVPAVIEADNNTVYTPATGEPTILTDAEALAIDRQVFRDNG